MSSEHIYILCFDWFEKFNELWPIKKHLPLFEVVVECLVSRDYLFRLVCLLASNFWLLLFNSFAFVHLTFFLNWSRQPCANSSQLFDIHMFSSSDLDWIELICYKLDKSILLIDVIAWNAWNGFGGLLKQSSDQAESSLVLVYLVVSSQLSSSRNRWTVMEKFPSLSLSECCCCAQFICMCATRACWSPCVA